LLKNYLVKLVISDKVVRQKANSSKSSFKKLMKSPKSSSKKSFDQTPKLSFLLD